MCQNQQGTRFSVKRLTIKYLSKCLLSPSKSCVVGKEIHESAEEALITNEARVTLGGPDNWSKGRVLEGDERHSRSRWLSNDMVWHH